MTPNTLVAQLREKAAKARREHAITTANLTAILDAFDEMRAALEWALDNADLSLADGNSRKLERRMNEVLQRLDAEIGGGK